MNARTKYWLRIAVMLIIAYMALRLTQDPRCNTPAEITPLCID